MRVLDRFAAVGTHLRRAPGHHNLGFGIGSHRLANCVPAFALRIRGHAARIDDVNIGRGIKWHHRKTTLLKRLEDFLSFVLINLATKGCKRGGRHSPYCGRFRYSLMLMSSVKKDQPTPNVTNAIVIGHASPARLLPVLVTSQVPISGVSPPKTPLPMW